MQDISSKALSLLYKQGTKETKDHLVENLSKAFAGETVEDAEMGEKDEDQELYLEFKDTSEYSEKMKTYKDLCKVAVELGHRELIY